MTRDRREAITKQLEAVNYRIEEARNFAIESFSKENLTQRQRHSLISNLHSTFIHVINSRELCLNKNSGLYWRNLVVLLSLEL